VQCELFKLQQNKPETSLQAKLAKELTTKYKIPELDFDTKATKSRSNYFTWWSRLCPILAMSPQMPIVFNDNEFQVILETKLYR
jgi:hypothetical protein